MWTCLLKSLAITGHLNCKSVSSLWRLGVGTANPGSFVITSDSDAISKQLKTPLFYLNNRCSSYPGNVQGTVKLKVRSWVQGLRKMERFPALLFSKFTRPWGTRRLELGTEVKYVSWLHLTNKASCANNVCTSVSASLSLVHADIYNGLGTKCLRFWCMNVWLISPKVSPESVLLFELQAKQQKTLQKLSVRLAVPLCVIMIVNTSYVNLTGVQCR